MTLAVRRYVQLRMRRATREHNLIWRQGKRSLFSGSLLFIIGVSLSYAFTRPIMGEVVEGLLGNGVFLVVVRARDESSTGGVTPHPPFNQALPLSVNARFRRFRRPPKSGL
ncbi:hypothetical protein [Mycolicibacterium sarraceniae]|uniref:Uncharacterized protein n=1 Tax=Mycolicibacterium sarraceniae TaxID=1534348 RepID=A0A7I7SX05_9MYCO|nr:hypothetical protein [Mycolicibacterium sarraceniae]BBY60336.1 hypothetical protein MSAR_34720 [Mycolicibacterium sarraceniae]